MHTTLPFSREFNTSGKVLNHFRENGLICPFEVEDISIESTKVTVRSNNNYHNPTGYHHMHTNGTRTQTKHIITMTFGTIFSAQIFVLKFYAKSDKLSKYFRLMPQTFQFNLLSEQQFTTVNLCVEKRSRLNNRNENILRRWRYVCHFLFVCHIIDQSEKREIKQNKTKQNKTKKQIKIAYFLSWLMLSIPLSLCCFK